MTSEEVKLEEYQSFNQIYFPQNINRILRDKFIYIYIYIYIYIHIYIYQSKKSLLKPFMALSDWAAEYIDCISTER